MKTLMITLEWNEKEPNAMHFRTEKIIDFVTRRDDDSCFVLFPSDRDSEEKKSEKINTIGIKVPIDIPFIRRIAYRKILAKRIKKLVKKIKPDLIYVSEALSTIAYKKDLDALKIYDIIGLVNSESLRKGKDLVSRLKSRYFSHIEKKGANYADYIFTVNKAHKREIQKFTDKPVIVFRDGVENYFLKSYNKEDSDKITVSFVGSIGKNRMTGIIRQIPRIVKKNQDILFRIIGDGLDLPLYKEMIKEAGCEDHVDFPGYIKHEKVSEYLKDSDICFSDDWSYIGFPTKVFEYMAMEKAVLVEDTPAVREIVKEGKNGFLYKDPKDFEKKLLLLASDKNLRDNLGKQAKKDIEENHTWKHREKQFNQIIDKIKNG
ncbi:MAG: glycosyltransferase [Candidatus Woesearchaeota archaeon]